MFTRRAMKPSRRHRGEIQWLQRSSRRSGHRFELMAAAIIASTATETGPALEVLLRLQDDNVPGGISPAEFLRAAERYRLMSDVDRWVVQTALTALGAAASACRRAAAWPINLSGQTLGRSAVPGVRRSTCWIAPACRRSSCVSKSPRTR